MPQTTAGAGDFTMSNRMKQWLIVPSGVYLDHRHRNWVLAEEAGDVVFAVRVVLVHRERAEHIAEALLTEVRALAARTAREAAPSGEIINARSRWRDILGWLGIGAGAAVFVAALALSLDDPALVVALAIGLRGGRLILDV